MKYRLPGEKRRRKTLITVSTIVVALLFAIFGVYYVLSAFADGKVKGQEPVVQSAVVTGAAIAAVPDDKAAAKEHLPKASEQKNEAQPAIVPENQQHQYKIIIDKSEYLLTLLEDGRVINVYPIAIGKNPGQKQRPGDLTTPTGSFTVDEILAADSWTHDFQDGKGEIAGAYGPWFISLVTGWEGIGIHGTHDPASIGTMVSEGCIRLLNEDLEKVKEKTVVGTQVIIQE